MTLVPPPLDGPSVAALRAFEAAARLGSFSRAAEELRVTPAAVAQHVKSIEAWAEQSLFERTARGVTLNDAGVRARPALTEAFHSLGAAAAQLRDGTAGVKTLRIAALPAIAELWLTPRLGEIRDLVPDADISIHAVDRQPDIERDGFDLLASYEAASDSTDHLVLVAAPDVAAGISTVDDLGDTVRLRDLAWEYHWATWLGDDRVEAVSTVDVTLFAMAVEAARSGTGVLVGRLSLLARDLERGVLVQALPRRVPTADRLTIRMRDDLVRSRLGDWVAHSLSAG